MRIRVLELNQAVTEIAIKHVSKSTRDKWLKAGTHEFIDARTIRVLAPAKRERTYFLALGPIRDRIVFDYDYPEQRLHPELMSIPALRYPIDIAAQDLETCY